MNRLPILKDELDFLEKHLKALEESPELYQLANHVKERIRKIRQEIQAIEEQK